MKNGIPISEAIKTLMDMLEQYGDVEVYQPERVKRFHKEREPEMRSSNANIATIEDYAQWILDECRDCRKRKKRIRLERISFWGRQITQFAQQDMCFRRMRNTRRYGK